MLDLPAATAISNAFPAVSLTYSNVIVSNSVAVDYGLMDHITNGFNVAGYFCWGAHSSLGANYPNNGDVQWSGNKRL